MTDKEIVKRAKGAEKRTRFGELVHSSVSNGVNSAYGIGFIEGMVEYRNSLQEELISEDLEEASKEWLRPQLDKSYASYGEAKMMELTHFDGYAMLDAIEFGAKWKEEQMMKEAVDAELDDVCGFLTISIPYHNGIAGDKVKVIIIKSE